MIGIDALVNIYRRLSCIRRYGTTPCNLPESVSSHMYLVGLISIMLTAERNDVDRYRVVGMALTHDLEESIQGDVVATVKRFQPSVRDALDEAASEFLGVVTEGLGQGEFLQSLWHEYKEHKTPEAIIAKKSDMIAQIVPMVIEHDLGNKYAEQIINNIVFALREADHEDLDEIVKFLMDRKVSLKGHKMEW